MSYPLDKTLCNYKNDKEYRACLRNIFGMKQENYPDTSEMDLDDITEDEMSYDDSSSQKVMDYILKTTDKHPLFTKLFELGAAKMISMDREIGLAILLSYDFLHLFHVCFIDFLENPDTFQETTESYVALLNYLKPTRND